MEGVTLSIITAMPFYPMVEQADKLTVKGTEVCRIQDVFPAQACVQQSVMIAGLWQRKNNR